jgi:hypothetical protein
MDIVVAQDEVMNGLEVLSIHHGGRLGQINGEAMVWLAIVGENAIGSVGEELIATQTP